MNEAKAHVQSLMLRLHFPVDAQVDLCEAFDAIHASKCGEFTEILRRYEQDRFCDYRAMLEKTAEIAEACKLHTYTASLLLFLCLSKTLLERYKSCGLCEEIYYRSMADLGYKLEECRLVHNINGSFVASWFSGFFAMTRFGLGRLQFEIKQTEEDIELDGTIGAAGSEYINVHIPRTGTRLCHQEVLEAYRLAAKHFSNVFEGKPILFACKSWLLDPWNLSVLKPDSNLAQFCRDFTVVRSGTYEDYRELWRLFDCMYTGDATKLPRNSSLRCAYADRVARGEPIGWGFGMFSYPE